jgi:hypothetical protein
MKLGSLLISRPVALFSLAVGLFVVLPVAATTLFTEDVLPSRRTEGNGGSSAGKLRRDQTTCPKPQSSQVTPVGDQQKSSDSKAKNEVRNQPDSHAVHHN